MELEPPPPPQPWRFTPSQARHVTETCADDVRSPDVIRDVLVEKKKLWFNIAMENPQNKWRLRSLGKSSISIRAIEKPWQTVSHNQRVILGYSMGIGTAPRHLWE